MHFHFKQLSKQATIHLSFHLFSPYLAMRVLAASRLISADFSTLVGVPDFQIEQRTSGEVGKKNTNTIVSFMSTCFYYILSSSLVNSSYIC